MAMDWSFFGGNGADGAYKMNPEFIKMMAQLGSGLGKGQSVGQATGDATQEMLRMQALQGNNPQIVKPTPKGQPGPDAITTKQTADGTVTTIQTPSEKNLSTYGTNVPLESMSNKPSNMGGVSDQSPFWKALLSQIS